MTRSKFPMHLRSNGKYSGAFAACGNYYGVHLPWRKVYGVNDLLADDWEIAE